MRLLVLICLLLCSVSLRAEVVAGLYDVQVDVDSTGSAALSAGARQGLETVLVRVSGQLQVADNAVIREALRKAGSYLRKYQYVVDEREGGPQRVLQMTFVEAQVAQLLQRAGLPQWSSNRPRVLIWLVADDASGRQFVSRESHPELVAGLEQQAAQRGLLLSFPLLDLTDSVSLSAEQMWGLDTLAARQASDRYNVDHRLVGRLSQLSSGSWLGSLVYMSDRGEQFLDVRGGNAPLLAAQPINLIADQLAARYAVVIAAGGELSLNIRLSGIAGFADYARVLQYLENLAVVEHANPVLVDGLDIIVNLHIKGSVEKLQEFLELDKKLLPVEDELDLDALLAVDAAPEVPADSAATEEPQTAIEPAPEPIPVYANYRWQG